MNEQQFLFIYAGHLIYKQGVIYPFYFNESNGLNQVHVNFNGNLHFHSYSAFKGMDAAILLNVSIKNSLREMFPKKEDRLVLARRLQERIDESKERSIPQAVIDYLKGIGYKMPLEYPFLTFQLPRISKNQAGSVSVYQNLDKLKRDITTPMKIGRWLKTVFPDIDDTTVAEASRIFNAETLNREIQWARTREEIAHVYEKGPHSCMAYSLDKYDTDGIRPVEVYATEDIGVAYLKKGERITARTVVNMKEKEYVRIYGDNTLQEILEDEGYSEGSLDGCRILRLENNSGYIVAPYLDGAYDHIDEYDDKYMVITRSTGVQSGNTNGLLDDDSRTCADCGERVDADEMYSTVYETNICPCCAENYVSVEGREHSGLYAQDDTDIVYYEGTCYHIDDLSDYDLVTLDNGEIYSLDEVVFCENIGDYVCINDAIEVTLANGDTEYTHKDDSDVAEDCVTGKNIYKHDATEVADDMYTLVPDEYESEESEEGAA